MVLGLVGQRSDFQTMTDEERKLDYISCGNDFRQWVLKAQGVLIAARILEKQYEEEYQVVQKVTTGVTTLLFLLPVVIFMYATVTELYLKALIISKQILTFGLDGKFPKGLKSHNLKNLAQCHAKLPLNDDEMRLLELLQDFIEIWGKYPIPLKIDKWRAPFQVVENQVICGGPQPIFIWDNAHLLLLKKILNDKVLPQIPV